jgi:FK506-binding protein 4/5
MAVGTEVTATMDVAPDTKQVLSTMDTTRDEAVAEKPASAEEAVDVVPDGGIRKVVLRKGTSSERPPNGAKVYVHYVGRLLDGTVFDSSRDRNSEFSFDLGNGSVIKGWDLGVATMERGELAKLICRSDYAYGERGSPPKIPANATLEFEVELLRWVDGEDLTHDGGVVKRVLTKSSSYTRPQDMSEVFVSYKVTLSDGTVVAEVAAPAEDTESPGHILGEGTLPVAIEKAARSMCKGEVAQVTVSKAYAGGLSIGDHDSAVAEVTLHRFITREDISRDGGVVKRVLTESSEYSKPQAGWTVVVDIVGRVQSTGSVFDVRKGVRVRLGCFGQPLPDFLDGAVLSMKRGEEADVIVQPSHAQPLPQGAPSDQVLVYRVKLTHVDKGKESWELKGRDKIEKALFWKDQGGEFFKAGNMARAQSCYSRGLSAVEYGEELKQGEVAHEVKKIKVTLHSNVALCEYKQAKYGEVVISCNKALELEPQNVKCLFRRAQAHFARQSYEDARRDLQRVLEIEPNNEPAKKELGAVNAKIKEQEQKDKKFYSKMFA